ncbi:MAG: hypothetical protein ACP5XB_20600 [Isosphaeraceae bacterium]
MVKQPTAQPGYMISIYDDPAVKGALRFTFVPKRNRQSRPKGQPPQPAPQYIVTVQEHGKETAFNWIVPPPHEKARGELEEIARERLTARYEWLDRLQDLVARVKEWADELDWATRVVDKELEDPEIGNHKAPGLLLQLETVRLFLEPVARDAPGVEGIVDLYRMPYYDDIAGLYFYNNRWNVHYGAHRAGAVAKVGDEQSRPLAKANFRKVLDEMMTHAG